MTVWSSRIAGPARRRRPPRRRLRERRGDVGTAWPVRLRWAPRRVGSLRDPAYGLHASDIPRCATCRQPHRQTMSGLWHRKPAPGRWLALLSHATTSLHGQAASAHMQPSTGSLAIVGTSWRAPGVLSSFARAGRLHGTSERPRASPRTKKPRCIEVRLVREHHAPDTGAKQAHGPIELDSVQAFRRQPACGPW